MTRLLVQSALGFHPPNVSLHRLLVHVQTGPATNYGFHKLLLRRRDIRSLPCVLPKGGDSFGIVAMSRPDYIAGFELHSDAASTLRLHPTSHSIPFSWFPVVAKRHERLYYAIVGYSQLQFH